MPVFIQAIVLFCFFSEIAISAINDSLRMRFAYFLLIKQMIIVII